MMPRSNLAAKRPVYVHVNGCNVQKKADYTGTGHLTTNGTLSERSQGRELYYHLAEDIMPQCILTSSVWIPQQNVVQTPVWCPLFLIAICESTVAQSKRIMSVQAKCNETKNNSLQSNNFSFSSWVFKHETICDTDHILILWTKRIRIQGVCCLRI